MRALLAFCVGYLSAITILVLCLAVVFGVPVSNDFPILDTVRGGMLRFAFLLTIVPSVPLGILAFALALEGAVNQANHPEEKKQA